MNAKSFSCGCLTGGCLVFLLTLGLAILAFTAYVAREASQTTQLTEAVTARSAPTDGNPLITEALSPIHRKYKLPALAAAWVDSQGLVAMGTVGVRKAGTDTPVTVHDQWHLGSCTKAMTATWIAGLVENGTLRWELALAEAFPALADSLDPAFRDVTLLHLLSHRAGLPKDLAWRSIAQKKTLPEQRLWCVQQALTHPPLDTPGTQYRYSNLGYVIAAAVAEQTLDRSWEEQIRAQLFEPLDMNDTGFGGTGTPGKIDQPWPHRDNGKPTLRNGPTMDNAQVLGPAGCVHSTLQDWARFIADQLRGARGQRALLSSGSYRTLHTPPFGGDYAVGWLHLKRDWAGGEALHHAGSNTMNFANVWVAPQRDFAILVCVNQGGDKTFKATDETVRALLDLRPRLRRDDSQSGE